MEVRIERCIGRNGQNVLIQELHKGGNGMRLFVRRRVELVHRRCRTGGVEGEL